MKIFAINGKSESWIVAADSADAAKKQVSEGSEIIEIADHYDGKAGLLAKGTGKLLVKEVTLA